MKVASGAVSATASNCTTQRGSQARRHCPASVKASSSIIAMNTVRPSSAVKGTTKIGFSKAATTTATPIVMPTCRS